MQNTTENENLDYLFSVKFILFYDFFKTGVNLQNTLLAGVW